MAHVEIVLSPALALSIALAGHESSLTVGVLGQGPRGLPGPAGPAGTAGSASPLIAFGFGDASPRTLFTPTAGSLILGVSVTVVTPFNGVAPSLQIGIAGQPELLVEAARIDLSAVTEFEINPNLILGAGQAVILTLLPGAGATQGAGRIFFEQIPAT